MKILLILNALVEAFFGLLFVFAPSILPIFVNADPTALFVIRMYGFAALTISLYSVLVFSKFHEQEVLVTGLLTLTVFHILITISQFVYTPDLSATMPAGIMHGIFALAFLVFYLKEK